MLGDRAVNEFSVSWMRYWWETKPIVNWPNHPQAANGITNGSPRILLRGYTIGQAHTRSPQDLTEQGPAIRNDFTYTFTKAGRHDLKLGGEFVYSDQPIFLGVNANGTLDAQNGPAPANLEALFPVWNDISTWNLNALAPLVRFYNLSVGDFRSNNPVSSLGGWAQDDWTMGDLTLNLGVRYDIIKGTYGEERGFAPFLEPNRPLDKNNLAPRLGFAYSLTERSVLRGGWGLFYGGGTGSAHAYYTSTQIVTSQVPNDGRPDFPSNPFNGPAPTYEQAVANAKERVLFLSLPSAHPVIPYSHQASIGLQRQVGQTMSITADVVYTSNHGGTSDVDVNLAYNPATGANYPFTDLSRRPYVGWGQVNQGQVQGKTGDSAGLQLEVNKRMANNWQASLGYSLSGDWSKQNAPIMEGCEHPQTNPSPGVWRCDVPITLHPVLQEERYRSGDQMHRLTFNGIWQMPFGVQLSGLYFYADNGKTTPTSGVDVLGVGGSGGRLRANGTLIERNSFNRSDLHRVDMRLQKRFSFGSRMTFDGMIEVFNLFNHENYNSFVTNEANSRYGLPNADTNIAFQPRTMQFGFRTTF